MRAKRFFVTGTDTGIGKTVVSALLCAALDAIYWKPIQTGTREGTDRPTVMRLAGLPRKRGRCRRLTASRRRFRRIWLRGGRECESSCGRSGCRGLAAGENLIAEGAGGALVPINETQLMTDLMRHLELPVVVVSRTALGTINHTLLSLAALRAARLDVRGVVMCGQAESRRIARRSSGTAKSR